MIWACAECLTTATQSQTLLNIYATFCSPPEVAAACLTNNVNVRVERSSETWLLPWMTCFPSAWTPAKCPAVWKSDLSTMSRSDLSVIFILNGFRRNLRLNTDLKRRCCSRMSAVSADHSQARLADVWHTVEIEWLSKSSMKGLMSMLPSGKFRTAASRDQSLAR